MIIILMDDQGRLTRSIQRPNQVKFVYRIQKQKVVKILS